MKECEWCEKEMLPQNFKKHQERCFYKNEVKLKKAEVKLLKRKRNPSKLCEDENIKKELEMAVTELKSYLTDSYRRTTTIYRQLIQGDSKNPIQKIKEMHLSEGT